MWKKKILCFENICFVLYSLLSFIWLWMHEPWRDEAQAWLIVRDLDISGIIKQMVWEGSPALSHMLILPLVKLGLPYTSMFLLHWLIAVVIIWILLYKIDISKYIKFGFIFSYYMLFEYVIVARNYNISILLLFLIASIFQNRHKKPILYSFLILLLFNTNVHSFGVASALTIVYLWEMISSKYFGIKNFIALFFMCLGAVLVFIQTPPGDALQQNAIIGTSTINFDSIFISIHNAFLPGFSSNLYFSFILSFVILLFLIRFLVRPKIFIILLFSFAWLFYIFGKIHIGGLRHHGFIMIYLIFSLLLEKQYAIEPITISVKKLTFTSISKLSTIILGLCLLLSIYQSTKSYYNEFKFNYSGSKEAAIFLKEHIPIEQVVIAHRSYACCSLLPYLKDHKFWYADREEFGTFLIWDEKFKQNAYNLSNKEVIRRAEKKFSYSTNIIFLLTTPLTGIELIGFELIYSTRRETFCKKDEVFYIYQENHE